MSLGKRRSGGSEGGGEGWGGRCWMLEAERGEKGESGKEEGCQGSPHWCVIKLWGFSGAAEGMRSSCQGRVVVVVKGN